MKSGLHMWHFCLSYTLVLCDVIGVEIRLLRYHFLVDRSFSKLHYSEPDVFMYF